MSSPRLCKYDCGKELTWDNATKSFKEQDGTPHTTERCKSLKAPKSEFTEERIFWFFELGAMDHQRPLGMHIGMIPEQWYDTYWKVVKKAKEA